MTPPSGDNLAQELRRSLDDGGFRVLYQPKYDLFRHRISSVEALVRWSSPTLGAVPPSRFIPVAEATGLIERLGRLVLDRACGQMALWRGEGLDLALAVNASPLQLRPAADFVGAVSAVLADSGLPPSALEIEVTESVLMEEDCRPTLERLRALGVSIALDDFGTGCSSLAYLRQLPAQTVKIDKSFVDGIPGSLSDCMLVGAIIRLAHSFGMSVVAEGVETVEQIEILDLAECDLVQGDAISPPASADRIAALVAAPGAYGPSFDSPQALAARNR